MKIKIIKYMYTCTNENLLYNCVSWFSSTPVGKGINVRLPHSDYLINNGSLGLRNMCL